MRRTRGLVVDAALRQRRQLLVGRLLLVEVLLEQVSRLVVRGVSSVIVRVGGGVQIKF